MRLGLYLDMRNPADSGRAWADHYPRWLERISDAEALGAEMVWLTEHHFFDDGYLPQTWTFAAAVAARTTRVRIGTAVAILPFHSALETAEQVALVDVISGGRIEPGFGVGYRKAEYLAHGADFKGRYATFEQRIGELRGHWGEGDGGLPLVTPGPLQRPLPLWGGFTGSRGARLSGRLGLGLQSIDPALLEPYVAGLADGGHAEDQARLGGVVEMLVADDPERAWALSRPHVVERWNSYGRHLVEGTSLPAFVPTTGDDWLETGQFFVGTPEQAARHIVRRCAGLPVSDVWSWADFPGLPEEVVDRHIELLLTQVRPRLAVEPGRTTR